MEASLLTEQSRRQFQYAYGINDGVNPVQETSGATVLANILSGLGIDEFLTRTDVGAGTTSHLLPDALGSAVALADSAGAVQTEYTYEPFGKTTVTGASNTNPFQYTGRENDGTGLYFYRARYHLPGLQRFVSEDALNLATTRLLKQQDLKWSRTFKRLQRQPQRFNLFTYVENKPSSLADPWGLFPIPAVCTFVSRCEYGGGELWMNEHDAPTGPDPKGKVFPADPTKPPPGPQLPYLPPAGSSGWQEPPPERPPSKSSGDPDDGPGGDEICSGGLCWQDWP